MAALIQSLSDRASRRASVVNSFDDWTGLWGLDALPLMLQTTMPKEEERADASFFSLVTAAYMRNAVVFACLAVRARLFSEARFQFQQLRGGRPGSLFGTADLALLENPEKGKTTRDLLQSAILDADLGGHGIVLGRRDAIRRLRPDWVTIAYGSKGRSTELGSWDPDAEIIGYGYYPGGLTSGVKPITFLPDEIAHFAPTKDPLARNRGISLLTAGLREVLADNASTTHKLSFFENAATPNLALKFPPTMNKEKALEWIDLFEDQHRGALNGFKTAYLGSGVEPTTIGLNFEQMDFAKVQGRAETRIAMLTGMHPVVVALSEGLQGSSLNAGNFGSAARLVADATLRPLWGDMAGSLQTITPPPPGSRLWYDDRDIPFLRGDIKDLAEIQGKEAMSIRQLTDAGFTPDSVVAAITGQDWTLLKHTNLFSVQLQPPGASTADAPAAYRARGDFWASSGPFEGQTIAAGTIVSADHPIVREFPSMFVEDQPAPYHIETSASARSIVTRTEVLETRQRLQAAGRPYGDDAVARELNVSATTVKRRRMTP